MTIIHHGMIYDIRDQTFVSEKLDFENQTTIHGFKL